MMISFMICVICERQVGHNWSAGCKKEKLVALCAPSLPISSSRLIIIIVITFIVNAVNKKNATCICSEFDQHMIPLVLVLNLTTRWRTSISSKYGQYAQCIGSNLGHWVALLAVITSWCRHMHCHIVSMIVLLALSLGIELVSSSSSVTSVNLTSVRWYRPRPIDRTPWTAGSDKNV